MTDHFAAFSFVDRITEYEPGRRARGSYAVPADVPAFPSCLVAEAVGQLAAWVAMAHIDFRGRPVAALANETRFRSDVTPGDTLDLAVDIESCDDDAVAYAGRARVDGRTSSSSSIVSVRCCPSTSSIRRPRWRRASTSSVAKARPQAASTASRSRMSSAPRAWRACRRARRCTCPNRPRFSAIISRAVPFFRRPCCSTRRSASRWKSRPRQRIGLREPGLRPPG